MSEETDFTAMIGGKIRDEVPEIGMVMLGYAFKRKTHSNTFKKIPYMMYPPPAIPKLVGICYGATFEDSYRAEVICDAILESAEKRKHVDISY